MIFNKKPYSLMKYSGKYSGIFTEVNIFQDRLFHKRDFNMIIPNIPDYHKLLYGDEVSIEYHLAGYASSKQEAYIRATGESIERYSQFMSETSLQKDIIFSSYNELRKSNNRVCDIKFLNVFTNKILKRVSKLKDVSEVTEEDIIGWIECKSIYDDKPVMIPAQIFFITYSGLNNEKRFYTPVSTGTASHISKEKALYNAILEYIQVDSVMISWYTNRKSKSLKISDNLKELINKFDIHDDFRITFLDFTVDKPIYVIGAFIESKMGVYPHITFGMQADSNIEKAIYRSFLEAYSNIGPAIDVDHIEKEDTILKDLSLKIESKNFDDLSSNALYFKIPVDIEKKHRMIQNRTSRIIDLGKNILTNQTTDILELIDYLKGISKFACYLDITSNEFKNDGWSVIRTVIPELMPLCLPSYPFDKHPRMLKFGGVNKYEIHPCP